MHLAKYLLSATHDIHHTTTKDSAKPSLPSAFHPSVLMALGKKCKGDSQMTETATLPRCHSGKALGKISNFPKCLGQSTQTKIEPLPSAYTIAIGKHRAPVRRKYTLPSDMVKALSK